MSKRRKGIINKKGRYVVSMRIRMFFHVLWDYNPVKFVIFVMNPNRNIPYIEEKGPMFSNRKQAVLQWTVWFVEDLVEKSYILFTGKWWWEFCGFEKIWKVLQKK